MPEADLAGATRGRVLRRGIGAGVLARLIGMSSPLVMVPLALGHIGADAYALWSAALSLTAMAVFADLGLGQGLMTKLTPLLIGAPNEARRLVSAAYSLLACVSVVGLVALLGAIRFVDVPRFLGYSSGGESDLIVTLCVGAFIINIPISLIVRVQFAAQAIAVANMWQAAGSLMALVFAGVGVATGGSPAVVIGGALVGPILANLLASVTFYRMRPLLAPRLVIPRRHEMASLFSLGVGFLALNVVMSVAVNLDVLIIGRYDGVLAVVSFTLALRIFMQVGSLVAMVNAPLWPLNAEAIARGDLDWVRRNTRHMTLISLALSSVVGLVLVVMGNWLFEVWAGETLGVTRWLLLGLAIYWTVVAGLSPRFMVQNSVGVLLPQFVGWASFLALCTPTKIYVLTAHGYEWITLVSAFVVLITVLPGCVWGYRRAMRESVSTTSLEDRVA